MRDDSSWFGIFAVCFSLIGVGVLLGLGWKAVTFEDVIDVLAMIPIKDILTVVIIPTIISIWVALGTIIYGIQYRGHREIVLKSIEKGHQKRNSLPIDIHSHTVSASGFVGAYSSFAQSLIDMRRWCEKYGLSRQAGKIRSVEEEIQRLNEVIQRPLIEIEDEINKCIEDAISATNLSGVALLVFLIKAPLCINHAYNSLNPNAPS